MGLWKSRQCPSCLSDGAVGFLWMTRCDNVNCRNYHPGLAAVSSSGASYRPTPRTDPGAFKPTSSKLSGDFDPGEHTVEIQYRNFNGEEKTFKADRRTVCERRNHVSACLTPTGARCAFKKDNILNFAELGDFLAKTANLRKAEQRRLDHYLRDGIKCNDIDKILQKVS